MNLQIVIGRVDQAPTYRNTRQGGSMLTFSIELTTPTGGRAWQKCVAWSQLADELRTAGGLTAGQGVLGLGRPQTRKWKKQDGSDAYTHELVLEDLILLNEDLQMPRRTAEMVLGRAWQLVQGYIEAPKS